MRGLYSISLAGLIMISLLALQGCSGSTTTGDLVLDEFIGVPEVLTPIRLIDLERYGILMPVSLIKYGEYYLIEKGQGNNIVDILSLSTDEIINCFRKGRGPGEVTTGSSFQIIDNTMYLYDISTQRYLSLDIDETIANRITIPNVVYRFNTSREDGKPLRPFVLHQIDNNRFISTGIFPEDSWFCLTDSCYNYLSGGDYLDYDVVSQMERDDVKHSFHVSSVFGVHPDGNKAICAFCPVAAFSIFQIDKTTLEEKYRYIVNRDPGAWSPGSSMGNAAISWKPESIRGYLDVCVDNNNIYLLYSGKKVGDKESPSYVCKHLLVYDWSGRPIERYLLDTEVSSIWLEENKLFCVTSYPNAKIVIYQL